MMNHSEGARLVQLLDLFQEDVHYTANSKGFWEKPNDGEKIALMHSELSECLDWIRHGNPVSDHIPGFTGAEEELADAIIRAFDYAGYKKFRVAQAMIAKATFNEGRPFKHGKNF